jgi:hypothetical protein
MPGAMELELGPLLAESEGDSEGGSYWGGVFRPIAQPAVKPASMVPAADPGFVLPTIVKSTQLAALADRLDARTFAAAVARLLSSRNAKSTLSALPMTRRAPGWR